MENFSGLPAHTFLRMNPAWYGVFCIWAKINSSFLCLRLRIGFAQSVFVRFPIFFIFLFLPPSAPVSTGLHLTCIFGTERLSAL